MNNQRNNKFIKAFGDNLRKIRIRKGMSQETLAMSADMERSQVARIERGEINTTISTVLAIANALEVEVTDLFRF